MSRRIVVVGTGTGVGKTHLSVALVRALAAAGHLVTGLKPIESGVGEGITDAELLDRAGTFHVKQPPPYALRAPISPHLAAAREGMTLRLEPVVAWVADVDTPVVAVIETAGGMLSPLGNGITNLDLACALDPEAVILVGVDRLGILHDMTATLFALRSLAPRLPEPLVALQTPSDADASTGSNARELVELGIARRVVILPRAPADSEAVQHVMAGVVRGLGIAPAAPRFT